MNILPRGIRNRNPGNILYNPNEHFVGTTDLDGKFFIFDLAENGIRAIGIILLTYYRVHGIQTIAKAIARWAPSNENDVAAYVADVAKRAGYDPNVVLNFYDAGVLGKLINAIIWHENGINPYSQSQIKLSVNEALQSS